MKRDQVARLTAERDAYLHRAVRYRNERDVAEALLREQREELNNVRHDIGLVLQLLERKRDPSKEEQAQVRRLTKWYATLVSPDTTNRKEP